MNDHLLVCAWRVIQAEPSGCFMWFDPETEIPLLIVKEPETGSRVGEGCEGDDPEDLFGQNQVQNGSSVDDLPF